MLSRLFHITLLIALGAGLAGAEELERVEPPFGLESSIERLGRSHLTHGNRVELLLDADEAWQRRLELIDSAEHHIVMSTFIWKLDRHGRTMLNRLSTAIRDKKAANPEFRCLVILDLFTPFPSSDVLLEVARRLASEGAEVGFYNPFTWSVVSPVRGRLHDKVLVVDGRRAILGGRNISSEYFGQRAWLDGEVLIEGPAAQEAQMHLLKVWAMIDHGRFGRWAFSSHRHNRQRARRLWSEGRFSKNGRSPLREFATADWFPHLGPARDGLPAAVVYDSSVLWDHAPTEDLLIELVEGAERRIDLVSPFINLTPELLDALTRAAERGVHLRLFTSDKDNWHHGLEFYRASIPTLLALEPVGAEVWAWRDESSGLERVAEAGCELLEAPGDKLHAKLAVVDDVGIVHSSNFNVRSVWWNTEMGLVVPDADFADRLTAAIDDMLVDGAEQAICSDQRKLPWPALFRRLEVDDFVRLRQDLAGKQRDYDDRSYILVRRHWLLLLLALAAPAAIADEPASAREDWIARWHQERDGYHIAPVQRERFEGRRIGLMPGVGVGLGLPDGVGAVATLLVSTQRDGHQPIFYSLGLEKSLKSELLSVGVGWGGVRNLPVSGHRLGFYGTSLRLLGGRDQDDEDLWGLAFGTEVSAGHLAVDFELGAIDGPGQEPALILKIRGKLVRPMLFGAD